MTTLTLDLALAEVANRSFYESCIVTPTDDGFAVEDDFNTCIPGDVVRWAYREGLDFNARNIDDHSGLMEPSEAFRTAENVRYYLPAAVEALEAGKTVAFSYLIVDALPETAEGIADDEAGLYDPAVGWVLAARILD